VNEAVDELVEPEDIYAASASLFWEFWLKSLTRFEQAKTFPAVWARKLSIAAAIAIRN